MPLLLVVSMFACENTHSVALGYLVAAESPLVLAHLVKALVTVDLQGVTSS